MTDLNWKGVCVCLMGEVRWRDVMRERHSLRLDQFRLGLMSPKTRWRPSRSLPQNRIFHVKLTQYTDAVVPTTTNIILCLCSWSHFLFAVLILNVPLLALSWVDCPNILSLDYSWCFAEGSATGPALAVILFHPWPCLLLIARKAICHQHGWKF